MNRKTVLCGVLTLVLLVGGLAGCASEKAQAARLKAKARITEVEAERIALQKVPGGKIREGGIEREKGRIIWSFDIAAADSKDLVEVAVDAMTGEVVEVSKESEADEAKEKKQ